MLPVTSQRTLVFTFNVAKGHFTRYITYKILTESELYGWRGPSNKICCQLQVKEHLYLPLI